MGAQSKVTGWSFVTVGKEHLRRPVVISAGAHVLLATVSLAAGLLHQEGSTWGEGGPGGAATLRLGERGKRSSAGPEHFDGQPSGHGKPRPAPSGPNSAQAEASGPHAAAGAGENRRSAEPERQARGFDLCEAA